MDSFLLSSLYPLLDSYFLTFSKTLPNPIPSPTPLCFPPPLPPPCLLPPLLPPILKHPSLSLIPSLYLPYLTTPTSQHVHLHSHTLSLHSLPLLCPHSLSLSLSLSLHLTPILAFYLTLFFPFISTPHSLLSYFT